MRIEHVGLYARDTATLARWYAETLDLPIVRTLEKPDRPPIFFLGDGNGAQLELLPATGKAPVRGLSQPGFSHLGLVVEDFHEAVAALHRAGVEVRDIRTTSAGWTIGYLEDPEGNIVELVHRPRVNPHAADGAVAERG